MDILEFKDIKTTPDPIHTYTDYYRNNGTPIVIDNGSYNCRIGWSTCQKPLMVFKNILAKPRKERGKKESEMQVGNDISNIEAVRFLLKSQFDRNVVTHYEVQENILNHSFSHLGIDTDVGIAHPIAFTEPFANPNYCRMMMSELLFECYNVPSVFYGVDGLLSFSRRNRNTGLVVSLGNQCSHIIPVVKGLANTALSCRLDIGGSHITYYMFRLMQLKYPAHITAITLSRAEELVHDHCRIALNYADEVSAWSDSDYYDNNVLMIQLPSAHQPHPPPNPDLQREKRDELRRKLVEINARKREEKLAEDEEQLSQLLAIQDLHEEGDEEEFQASLAEFGLSDSDELQKIINQIQVRIEKTRQKIVAANTAPEDPIEEPKSKVPKFSTPKDEEDFKSWIADLVKKRDDILERRAARRAKRAEAVKRRTPAAIERMRIINQLARNDEKKEDDFGARDDDWDIYKAINKDGGGDSSDSDCDDAEKLVELEGALRSAGWMGSAAWAGQADDQRRLHVSTEIIRATECLFQPCLFGVDQMGLSELAAHVISQFKDESVAMALAANVILTGGPSRIPGLIPRMTADLTAARPFGSVIKVSIADEVDPSLSAWYALRNMATSVPYFTREEYLEKGGEYLKPHFVSNSYFATPMVASSATTNPLRNPNIMSLPIDTESLLCQ